jgi:hypothetical protein
MMSATRDRGRVAANPHQNGRADAATRTDPSKDALNKVEGQEANLRPPRSEMGRAKDGGVRKTTAR